MPFVFKAERYTAHMIITGRAINVRKMAYKRTSQKR
jgi:hypothetical protein